LQQGLFTGLTHAALPEVMSERRRGKTVMLDCGIHPGYAGKQSLPYFDEIEMEEVDAMLVTHFHLDHCAAVPYVTAQTPFKVRCRI